MASLVPNLGQLVVNWLAIVGGAAVGGLGTGWLVKLLARVVGHRPVPPRALTLLRLLGGTAAGLVVYMLVFGTGGGGFGFGGGGWGFGGRGSQGDGGATGPTVTRQPTSPERLATGPTGTVPDGTRVLRVEMLGGERYKGEVREFLDKAKDRYYLVAGRTEPQTLDEVRQLLQERTDQIKEVEITILQKGSVAESHVAVKELKQLAADRGLTVKVVKPGATP
jgi:hypothetical protein